MAAATGVFAPLEAHIRSHGTEADGSIDFNELSLIGEGDERAIAFQILGSDFLLTPEENVISVESVDGEVETFALGEDIKKAVHSFLRWRIAFVQAFGL